jgi:thiamine-monophosphate kinase
MQKPGVEFQIIQQYFESHAGVDKSIALGIGDDCALIIPTTNTYQVISVDTSIADRHFPNDADAYDIAYRALNVSLSDLAAMGAKAKWFTLAISLPEYNALWLSRFSQGLFQAAHNAGVHLIGGDTTKGSLTITVQVQGELPIGKALQRNNAKVGDYIYVSGYLGNAGAGLLVYQKQLAANNTLLTDYLKPEPELVLGEKLLNIANSCIDISDGLLADLSHILRASNVGAEIDLAHIPLSDELLSAVDNKQALQLALQAGDDYKLCFTSAISPEQLTLEGVFCIGCITENTELTFKNKPYNFEITTTGFDHFS